MIIRKAKRIVLPLIAAVVIGPTLSSCTDREVNTAVGVIAIGAGIAIIAASASGRGGSSQPVVQPHQDHRGGGIDQRGPGGPGHDGRDGRDGRGGMGGRGGRMSALEGLASADVEMVAQQSDLEVNVKAFAKTFSLQTKSASLFLSAMQKAKNGDARAIQKLGLSQRDIDGLKEFQLPSESGIRAVAKNIQADVLATRDMLQALVNKAAEQRNVIDLQTANL